MESTLQFPPSSPPPQDVEDASPLMKTTLLPPFDPKEKTLTPLSVSSFSIHHDRLAGNLSSPTALGVISNHLVNQPKSWFPPVRSFYPTPAPTSSAGVESSSPPRSTVLSAQFDQAQSDILQISARCPLSSVTLVVLPRDGSSVKIGRSSQSCNFALSKSNRLVSRVHLSMNYNSVDSTVDIKCLGYNGVSIIVPQNNRSSNILNTVGQEEFKLTKNQVLNIKYVPGMTIEAHGDRALVELAEADIAGGEETEDEIHTFSPTPLQKLNSGSLNRLSAIGEPIPFNLRVESGIENMPEPQTEYQISHQSISAKKMIDNIVETQNLTVDRIPRPPLLAPRSKSVGPEMDSTSVKRDIIRPASHSPGPSRKVLKRKYSDQRHDVSTQGKDSAELKAANVIGDFNMDQISSVVSNYLAFSRLSSTPISIIQSSNPTAANISKEALREILQSLDWIGVIYREGKDAAGKPLEEEYYYVYENDTDPDRRAMVDSSRGHGGLRACRRTHKQVLLFCICKHIETHTNFSTFGKNLQENKLPLPLILRMPYPVWKTIKNLSNTFISLLLKS